MVADSSARASQFLSTLASTLVALAFVGQFSRLGTGFFAFAFVLFPTLFFLGLVTFERVLQSAMEDTIYIREINRVRHFYTEAAPLSARYFLQSTHDDKPGVALTGVTLSSRWQAFLSTAGMIEVINSVILGALAALVVVALVGDNVAAAIGVGIVFFAVSLVGHYLYHLAKWHQVYQQIAAIFPSTPVETERVPGSGTPQR